MMATNVGFFLLFSNEEHINQTVADAQPAIWVETTAFEWCDVINQERTSAQKDDANRRERERGGDNDEVASSSLPRRTKFTKAFEHILSAEIGQRTELSPTDVATEPMLRADPF